MDPEGLLSREELTRRASAGVFVVATRGVAMLLIAFAGNIVVARLLSPRDFGIVAIGASLVLFASMLADGGLGGALIRRAEPPRRDELRAMTGLQLVATLLCTVVALAVGSLFGEAGLVVAVMVASMPVAVLQLPGRITLERSLRYRPLAIVEIAQVLTYHAWAIGFVVAGAGVWGLATATVAMRVVAAFLMVRVSPVGWLWPRLSWKLVRPLMAFGLRFQGVSATLLAREQGLNMAIGAVAGVSVLGLWSLAKRLLEIPFLLLESLSRVSFPTMSQLVNAKEDVSSLIERAIGMAAIGGGILLAALAGSAPGIVPGLFGEQWSDASDAVPLACLGLAILGPLTVSLVGYLYAVGDAGAVLRATTLDAVVIFAVTLPLLGVLGVTAVGVGWAASSAVQAFMLARAAQRWTRIRVMRALGIPLLIGIVSGAAGWLVADLEGRTLLSGLAGGLVAVACFHAGLYVFRRSLMRETFRFAFRSMRAAASRTA